MIGTLSRLFRWRLALVNGAAALGGLFLFPGGSKPAVALPVFAGVALLAAAGSALNQLLERDLDKLMVRTASRPLPTGELVPRAVALIGAGCAAAGSLALWRWGGSGAASLAGAALFWYLLVYTPLKRRTPFALVLGALCGAVPPIIGWCAAGGDPTDLPPLHLALLLFLWQVPHFWLLRRRHAEDYRHAGFPMFAPERAGTEAGPFFLLWALSLGCSLLMLPAFGMLGKESAACCAALCLPLPVVLSQRFQKAFLAYLNILPVLLAASFWWGK